MFLEQMVVYGQSNFTDDISKKLSTSRGLSRDTLMSATVGYLPALDTYLLPVYACNGTDIVNIKLYDMNSFRNTAGCQAAMYGLWNIAKVKDYSIVFITEGEWDTLMMTECLKKLKITDAIVIGAPGAGTFKQETLQYCIGKKVYILYDNDLAGQTGADKVARLLAGVSNETFRLKWPEGLKEGYDVRDIYTKEMKSGAKLTYDKIISLSVKVNIASSAVSAIDPSLLMEPITSGEVYNIFSSWLHMPDMTVLDVIFGTVLANRLPGDPLWMFIVAPPGATKTEPLLALSGGIGIEAVSSLTPHTLISGANFGAGGDPSLIPQLNNKVLIIKDFTSVLGLPSQEREEIFAILRDAYDGECSKPFGNGIFRRYKSRFGILAAVTPAIELFTEEHAALGERFLRWRNFLPSSVAGRAVYIRKALGNVTKEVELRAELNTIAKRVLLGNYGKIPLVSEDLQERIIGLAQWISMMRGTVSRDKYSKEILHKSFTELGTRVSKQLYKLLLGVTMFKRLDSATEEIYKLVSAVAKSSVSGRYLEVVQAMRNGEEYKDVVEIQQIVRDLPRSTITLVLQNLGMLGIAKQKKESQKNVWALHSEIVKLMDNCKL